MPIRSELYRTRSRSAVRSVPRNALLVCVVLCGATLVTSAGGCQAIKERRANKAAQRQARDQARAQVSNDQSQERVLPNADPDQSQAQSEWLRRQAIARNGADPASGAAQPQTGTDTGRSVEQTPSGMTIVDERTNTDAGTGPGADTRVVSGSDSGPFTRQSREEQSLNRAVELHSTGDLKQALAELERAIAFNPQFTPAYIESGDIYLELGQFEDAERQYALAVRSEPRNYMAQYRHAQVLHKLGRLEDANRAYLRALSIRPASFDANLGLSTVLLEMGRAEQALPYGQRAVKSEPPSGRARMHLGNVYAALDRYQDAVVEYQQAAELMDAPTPGLLLNMSESLNQLKRYAEMVGALDQLVRIDPTAIAYERLGSGLFRLKRYDESLAAFKKSAEMDPTHYPAFNGIAVCELNTYLWSSKTDGAAREQAVEAMRQSIKLRRDQPRIVELLRRYKDASGTEE